MPVRTRSSRALVRTGMPCDRSRKRRQPVPGAFRRRIVQSSRPRELMRGRFLRSLMDWIESPSFSAMTLTLTCRQCSCRNRSSPGRPAFTALVRPVAIALALGGSNDLMPTYLDALDQLVNGLALPNAGFGNGFDLGARQSAPCGVRRVLGTRRFKEMFH